MTQRALLGSAACPKSPDGGALCPAGTFAMLAMAYFAAIASIHAVCRGLVNTVCWLWFHLRYLQATAALIQSPSSSVMSKLLHLIAWLPARRFGAFTMSLAAFAWHWICAESPNLQVLSPHTYACLCWHPLCKGTAMLAFASPLL